MVKKTKTKENKFEYGWMDKKKTPSTVRAKIRKTVEQTIPNAGLKISKVGKGFIPHYKESKKSTPFLLKYSKGVSPRR